MPLKKLMFKGSVWRCVVPPNSVKIFSSDISTDIKNTSIVNLVVQKLDFWGSILEGSAGGWHPQTMSKYLSVVSVGFEK